MRLIAANSEAFPMHWIRVGSPEFRGMLNRPIYYNPRRAVVFVSLVEVKT